MTSTPAAQVIEEVRTALARDLSPQAVRAYFGRLGRHYPGWSAHLDVGRPIPGHWSLALEEEATGRRYRFWLAPATRRDSLLRLFAVLDMREGSGGRETL